MRQVVPLCRGSSTGTNDAMQTTHIASTSLRLTKLSVCSMYGHVGPVSKCERVFALRIWRSNRTLNERAWPMFSFLRRTSAADIAASLFPSLANDEGDEAEVEGLLQVAPPERMRGKRTRSVTFEFEIKARDLK